MVNLQRYLISKGLDTTDAKDLRRNIRIHLTAASSEDRLPPPNIRKIPYKFIDDPDRSAMDILCDSIRGAMTAEHIPCDTFGSIVKMVLSSDLSDARQKEKRKLETETARAACAKAQIDEEAATIAMAERKVMYNVAKIVEKSEILQQDGAFVDFDTAVLKNNTATSEQATASITESTARIVETTATTTSTTATLDNSTALINETTATTTSTTATLAHSTATTDNCTALLNETTATVSLATASNTQSTLLQCSDLDIQIRKAQLEEALTRAALAKFQLAEAQAVSNNNTFTSSTVATVVPARVRQPKFTREMVPAGAVSMLSLPALRPVKGVGKKKVTWMGGTK